MTHHEHPGELSPEELEEQEGESLPDREVMSILPIEPTVPPPEGDLFDIERQST